MFFSGFVGLLFVHALRLLVVKLVVLLISEFDAGFVGFVEFGLTWYVFVLGRIYCGFVSLGSFLCLVVGFSGVWVFGGLLSTSACLGVKFDGFRVCWKFVVFIWFVMILGLWVETGSLFVVRQNFLGFGVLGGFFLARCEFL